MKALSRIDPQSWKRGILQRQSTFAKARLIQGWVKNHDGSSFKGSFRESGPEFHYKQGTYTLCADAIYQYTVEILNDKFHGQGTIEFVLEPEYGTTFDNGEP